ncbi:hypothetical protein MES4922_160141 [Mesorhizobium ventifaucium]|uniref:Uncharacterized protein n=1 Tax=Mesorhizobium ventifaucium TaxID=666020 RepID=A0ABM9DIB0_9HYPH|nr:hypothetical protein MES4922_160141 [Mesorhizobium ventifaucium]
MSPNTARDIPQRCAFRHMPRRVYRGPSSRRPRWDDSALPLNPTGNKPVRASVILLLGWPGGGPLRAGRLRRAVKARSIG